MRVLVHECRQDEIAQRRDWIQTDLRLPIFKEESARDGDTHIFYMIAMEEEEITALNLKYPPGTFKNV